MSSSSSEWPPQWKDVKECPQYKYYMIPQFLELDVEEFKYLDGECYYPNSDRTAHETVKIFIDQVRRSRGYDVDVYPPPPVDSPFMPVKLAQAKEDKWLMEDVMKSTGSALNEINAQAKEHGAGTRYELKDLEKIVDSLNQFDVDSDIYMQIFLTFTVKEFDVDSDCDHVVKTVQAMVSYVHGENLKVMEWRFKPDELPEEISPQVSGKSQGSAAAA